MLSLVLESNKYKNRDNNDIYHEEYQYLNLINDIIKHGTYENGRNGKTKMIFGSTMIYSLKNNTIPILTTKRVAFKTCLKELLWFISGSTDNKILQEQGVTIWNGNSGREYLDSIGLNNYNDNDLGPIYGFQWRHFNADYIDCKSDYNNMGIDQLEYVISCLKDPTKRSSRRLIISAWNPCQLNKMVLPPCHVLMQFNVRDGTYLSCSLYQRSGDVGLGVPFNIASYSYLTHLIAYHCDLIAENFVYYLGNAHIYDDHEKVLTEQKDKQPFNFPKINIKNKYDSIDKYKLEDFEIIDYMSHEKIKMEMRK
tara:strand:- start:3039 stop:3968 length:930 start_codon:yes stop_codon:yes gene_type:complete